jgi:hypothetical protein
MLLSPSRNSPAIYRVRPRVTTDSYGDPVEDWSNPERLELKRASTQAVTSTDSDGVTVHVSRNERKLFVPGTPDLVDSDRVEIKGEMWRVDGDPETRAGLAASTLTTAILTRLKTT